MRALALLVFVIVPWMIAPAFAQPPDEVNTLLTQGEALVHQGRLIPAQEFFERARIKFPDNPDLSFDLGMVFFLQHDWPKAIENYQKSLEEKPDQVDPLYYMAQAYFQTSRLTLARETIARAAALAPNNPDVCQEYGEYLAAIKETREEGLKWLKKAHALNPDLDRIEFDIGLAQFNLNDFFSLKDYEGAIVSFQAALKKDPANGEAAFLLAESWSALSEWAKARENYNYAFSHGYSSPPAYYGLGTALVQLGEYEAAIRPLKMALKLNPTLYKAHFQLAKAYRGLGRIEEAKHESEFFETLYQTGNSAATYAQFQAATQTPAWAHVKALLEKNKEQEALDYIAKVPRQDQDTAQSLNSNPYYLLAVVYNTMGRTDDAKRELEIAKTQEPANAQIPAYLGIVQLSLGEMEPAEKSYSSALLLDPANELAIIGLAEIRYKQQRWEDVISRLEGLRTGNLGALYMLCDAYYRVGKTGQATTTAEIIRSLAVNNKSLLDDLDQLIKRHQADQPGSPSK